MDTSAIQLWQMFGQKGELRVLLAEEAVNKNQDSGTLLTVLNDNL